MLASFQELCCFGRVIHGVLALLGITRQQIDHWNERGFGNPSIFMCQTDLVESKWGRIIQISRIKVSVKGGCVSHSPFLEERRP